MSWRRALAAAALLVTLRLVYVAAVILWVGQHDRAVPSDAIIVLGAAAYHHRPSPVLAARIDHALALYERGVAPTLIFTGGFGDGAPVSEARAAMNYAVERGVPDAHILIEERSRTTLQNLEEARALMRAAELETAVVVSDPLHLRRALIIAEDLGIEAVASPTPTSRFRTWRTQLPFLAREVYFVHHYQLIGQ
jgi:uncharacterized SAM-binding protein YcdF (DUF218 family)